MVPGALSVGQGPCLPLGATLGQCGQLGPSAAVLQGLSAPTAPSQLLAAAGPGTDKGRWASGLGPEHPRLSNHLQLDKLLLKNLMLE